MKLPRKRIRLEPELEKIAGNWDGWERIDAAQMFKRWARELEVTGFMMIKSADDDEFPSAAQLLRRLRRELSGPSVRQKN